MPLHARRPDDAIDLHPNPPLRRPVATLLATLLAALVAAVPPLSACKPGDGDAASSPPSGARSPDSAPTTPPPRRP